MSTKAEREAAEVTAAKINSTRSALIHEAKTLRDSGRTMLADELHAFAVAARSDELARFREIVIAA